ncbi:MAG: hypothetical protein JRN56_02730 [Nitrososphaerota archaeon]|nr:Gar1/Naf1 family protein [Nitrososphaerota archaeon]MDG6913380.1 hypothetical protein [Nitrososphaerota archaeon]MDG6937639.1 hypothetical protein [Nitrososphaerota archaeon]MDG6962035.1 hypothetical protein [Nitrososphaerota archaeon]MDG6969872.1 hypothetical protein [Nitrososphaerota archaeon]
MHQVGTVIHRAKSGRLVVRLTKEVRPGVFLFDEGKRKLGRIGELIGPVKSPYASVVPASSRAGRPGEPAFAE